MQPVRAIVASLLAATTLFGAASASHSEMKPNPPSPVKPIPGGPIVVKVPDLVIDSIDVSWSNTSPCTGLHTATFDVTVKIRNAGFAPAVMPGPWQPAWITVWSIIGGTGAPYKVSLTGPPSQLASGQTATFKTKLGVMALVQADKSKSSIGIGVIVDPEKKIAEGNESNNFKDKQIVFGGEFCPAKR